ncbi:MAG: hypothetical protein AAF975_04295, partial [Spirochaetota bacterium]
WLQQLALFESGELSRCWSRILENLQQAGEVTGDIALQRSYWLAPLDELNELLHQRPDCGLLWNLRGLCLLYGYDAFRLPDLNDGASRAFFKARERGWRDPLPWQSSYYLGLSYYWENSYSEAEACFLDVLRHDTGHGGALYWLEKIYLDWEDPRYGEYQSLLQNLHPNFPDLIQNFASV